jgi:uncharacterized protein (DUF58 family)
MREVPLVTSLYTLLGIRIFAAVGVVLLLARGLYLPASFLIAILMILVSCRLWADYGLHRLGTNRETHPVRLFPGDVASFSVRIQNDKRLPVSLEVWQPFPEGLNVTSSEQEDGDPGGRRVVFLGKYAENLLSFRITGMSRGCYEIPPGRVNSKDLLGLFHRERRFGEAMEILVYPALLDMEDRDLAQHFLMGDTRSDRPFMPDPTRVSSLRDYTPDIPARRIHWKASARHGKLLAKVLEHTADLRLCVTLDGDSFSKHSPSMEKALSVAATLTVWAERKKIPFGLISNVSQCGRSGPVSIPAGSGPSQVRLALEALARAKLPVALPYGEFLSQEKRLMPWGTTIISIRGDNSGGAPSGDGVSVEMERA